MSVKLMDPVGKQTFSPGEFIDLNVPLLECVENAVVYAPFMGLKYSHFPKEKFVRVYGHLRIDMGAPVKNGLIEVEVFKGEEKEKVAIPFDIDYTTFIDAVSGSSNKPVVV